MPTFGSFLLRMNPDEISPFLEALSRLSVAVFAPDRLDETWLSDANQMLLTAWVFLSTTKCGFLIINDRLLSFPI